MQSQSVRGINFMENHLNGGINNKLEQNWHLIKRTSLVHCIFPNNTIQNVRGINFMEKHFNEILDKLKE